MCGWTISSATDRLPGGVSSDASLAQKREERRKKLRRLLHVRHVPAVIQDDARRPEGTRRRLRRLERDGIFPPVEHEGGELQRAKRGEYVVLPERLPDGLLDPPGHAEWREVPCAAGIGEVAGH